MTDNPVGQMGGADFPKGPIGNYKGVMLCNRPNEFGGQRVPERSGEVPFKSRVESKEPLGWNPPPRLVAKAKKVKKCSAALMRHRQFLNKLEQQKQNEFDDKIIAREERLAQEQRFREQTQRQRDKMRQVKAEYELQDSPPVKESQPEMAFDEVPPSQQEEPISVKPSRKSSKLNKENLSQLGSERPSTSKLKPKRGKTRPAWAVTKKMEEEEKEKEVDDLIEFAYDLDYEKFMEDYEVRQALAIIQDRVKEIKQDEEWKAKMADEWNKAAQEDANEAKEAASQKAQSVYSYKSGVSKASVKSRVQEEMKKWQEKAQSEWDTSTVNTETRKMTTEERMARKIAKEVLRENKQLGNVHSGASIQKLLEREANKQLAADASGSPVKEPVINSLQTRGAVDPANPSTLPYLHKNPAI